ncbi:thiol-disulfide oxidoreductase DCC family protein [Paenisporosarcina cavernae]|uniref:DUF393 domain-containing protein n=1 Tax=Paenisporosarcina cavernae TaxID=2320858 RepID=A0A385YYR3_9BACL|nr:DCC1-like thiol-disulfide oxidoreductase family protein [Paenisporosarcina cavernae]AYC30492.1 DUF393 domain-containing protein [Paenisporosarcina cavernae]
MRRVILFDGMCNFCSGSVQFILKHEKDEDFQLASLQSDVAKRLLAEFVITKLPDSLVYIEGKTIYVESDAALNIARHLHFPWVLGYSLRFFPKLFRDGVYRFIAKNRYKWFGKRKACFVPTPEIRKRFL